MQFSALDISIIAIYLFVSLGIGLVLRKQAGKSLSDFFLSGRKLPWWVAGISMVATTFAADTPLLVSGLVAKSGISGNWLWWNMLIGGMLTVFFFAHLWRRAEVLTELELIELRYSGAGAAFLRGFKAVYLGVFLNVLVIAWVNYAMMKILQVFFGMDAMTAFWWVGALMLLVAFYSSLAGLKGVAITDALQFVLAMVGCIVLAWLLLDTPEVGGVAGLRNALSKDVLSFVPRIGPSSASEGIAGVLAISSGAFLTHALVQWWASWYPGAEPGGGGYVAQRMMSTPTENDARKATLLFTVAHYCLRPWPWIITGLCVLVLYPELPVEQAEEGFVMAMRDHLPNGWRGALFAAFLAAYMSTISTQLNWGASFLTNDVYKRFLGKNETASENRLVLVGRSATIIIMLIAFAATSQVDSIESTFMFLIECGAGMGMVLILRWYYWRINVWSEIVATLAPFLGYWLAHSHWDLISELFAFITWYDAAELVALPAFPSRFLFTTTFTTIAWVLATFLTPPEAESTLTAFYRKVYPGGWWGRFAKLAGKHEDGLIGWRVACWLSAVAMTYGLLFFIGKLILFGPIAALPWAALSIFALTLLGWSLRRIDR